MGRFGLRHHYVAGHCKDILKTTINSKFASQFNLKSIWLYIWLKGCLDSRFGSDTRGQSTPETTNDSTNYSSPGQFQLFGT
jgi:hypothetical protein